MKDQKKTEGYQLLSPSSVDSRGLETRPDAGQEVGEEDEWGCLQRLRLVTYLTEMNAAIR
jgi:hypothetical protein